MTKEEALRDMNKKKTISEWLEFEKEYYETLTKEERDEIGGASFVMTETCGLIRAMGNVKNG